MMGKENRIRTQKNVTAIFFLINDAQTKSKYSKPNPNITQIVITIKGDSFFLLLRDRNF